MNILIKNRETLTRLFNTFTLQEMIQVNQNLNVSWHLLSVPPEQILRAMKLQQVSLEHFLGKRCLPLIRFYLADDNSQKATFLSMTLLEALFTSLPAVEAMLFKLQINNAQRSLQQTNQALSSLLSNESLVCSDSVITLNRQPHKDNAGLLNEQSKSYLNCFYYLREGELHLLSDDQMVDDHLLLYSELSPLQQLQAQKMCSIKKTSSSEQAMLHSASA